LGFGIGGKEGLVTEFTRGFCYSILVEGLSKKRIVNQGGGLEAVSKDLGGRFQRCHPIS